MESAQAQQKLAETQLEKLAAHTQGLDEVVRDEIRRTLIDEMQAVTAESRRAAEGLRRMQRAGSLRAALWSFGLSALCAGIPGAAAWWALPAPGELLALRTERDQAAANLKRLEQLGGRVDLRRCGRALQLCVRIDRHAPVFGESADYFVVKGY
jgi:hypothetical protein